MNFRPQVGDQLTIDNVTYRIAEHPAAPGIPYGQAGRRQVGPVSPSTPVGSAARRTPLASKRRRWPKINAVVPRQKAAMPSMPDGKRLLRQRAPSIA